MLTIEQLIDQIRELIGETMHLPEVDVLAALCNEAEDWKMRLYELEGE